MLPWWYESWEALTRYVRARFRSDICDEARVTCISSIGGPLETPYGKVGAKASSVRNCEHDYAGEPKNTLAIRA